MTSFYIKCYDPPSKFALGVVPFQGILSDPFL